MNIIYINGKLLEQENASISPDERGFRFGDGVFETIPLHNAAPYLLEYHMDRLRQGLLALGIDFDVTTLPATIERVIAANNAADGLIRLYVSRGIGSQGYLPVSPAPTPTIVIQYGIRPPAPQAPVSLWLSDYEKISPRALPTACKLAQGLNATLARMQACANGCYDALQLSGQNHISEASSANIFWVKEDKIFTPALSTGALAGVTRKRIMELLPTPVIEIEATLIDMQLAEEVFLTNASFGVVPVHTLLPSGYIWQKTDISQVFSQLRTQDIERSLR